MLNPESPPELIASRWYNTGDAPPTLKGQRGKVVIVAVFQMLCPGSVKYGLPQAMRLKNAFNKDEVAVLGLHMAFENFDKQSPGKVEEFLRAQGITIPVAHDKANGDELPETMAAYEMQGTPAILVFDRQGRLRRHYLGAVDDLRIGAEIMALLMEDEDSPRPMSIAIERRLALALTDPQEHEHGCGHDHHHDHEHDHDHDHAHAGGCCGGGCGGHGHDDEHEHEHEHEHDHGHTHAGAKEGCDGKGGCGCKH